MTTNGVTGLDLAIPNDGSGKRGTMPTAIETDQHSGFHAVSESLTLMREMLMDIRIGASVLKEVRLGVIVTAS